MSEATTASEAFERWKLNWTGAGLAARRAEETRRARAEREQQRAEAASPAELTIDALLAKLDFSREYAEHLMQPYCHCGHRWDGWDYCHHARDLGSPERDSKV